MRMTKLGCAALLVLGCQNETAPPVQETAVPKVEAAKTKQVEKKESPADAQGAGNEVVVPGVVACSASDEVETWGKRLIENADANHDGRVSKKEAQSFVNFLMGGFFFRADENSDGRVTAEEGKQARQEFAENHPTFARLLATAKTMKQQTQARPFARLAEIMDIEYPDAVSAKEVRDRAREALDELYRVVDENNDSYLVAEEAKMASVAGAAALGHQAFVAADGNSDGAVDPGELEAAVQSGVKTAFRAADGNDDGKLTEGEAASALQALARQLMVPQPNN